MAIATIDPTTGKTLRTFTAHTAEEVEHTVAAAFAPRIYDLLSGEG